jgi:alanyl-tRNA synthetase
VRAGGKHNDLDNVGYTSRHHTFFEMLGNFSFGDYFKREAISYAWEYLVDVLKIPKERLWVTVHVDDDEAADIWINEMGFDPDRISRLGDKDNFWMMAETGPCGPSSEIFFDHGPEVPGGPPGTEDGELDRFVEVWNLVFTQFDRSEDGVLTPLPKQCVDTGMGLERLAAVMQNVHSNYDIDLFQNILKKASKLLGYEDLENASLKVIADHIRSSVFLITDGVLPSNEGRGYVLRRIIRRALRHGHNLQSKEPFFHKLVDVIANDMGEAYPLVVETRDQISRILLKEEQQFEITLDQGMKILGQEIAGLELKTLPGTVIFKLYDTYGFPVDLTADICREKGLKMDMDGFEQEMEAQRDRARAASKFDTGEQAEIQLDHETLFLGYEQLSGQAKVVALYKGDESVESLHAGDSGLLVVNETPFYAESGGQVGDRGRFVLDASSFAVADTQKRQHAVVHMGTVETGQITVGENLVAEVDQAKRQATVLNHSATHLMHAALREVLGNHVQQRGSLVDPERLRFDFSHFEAVTGAEIRLVERIVNEQIRGNSVIQTEILGIEQARQKGAMALFGEKYSEEVRVLTMGDGYSIELCGGTHASRTGDIGVFRIISEEGIASGVRRIEALTGAHALDWIERAEDCISVSASLLKTPRLELTPRIQSLLEQNKQLEKKLQALNAQLASHAGSELADDVIEIKGIKVIVQILPDTDAKALPDMLDQLKNKLNSGIVVLATVNGGKVALIAGVTRDLTKKVQAGELVNVVAEKIGGKGGGRPDMARAGGTDSDALPGAMAVVPRWLEQKLTESE